MPSKTIIGFPSTIGTYLIVILLISGCVKYQCGDDICQRLENSRANCPEDCKSIPSENEEKSYSVVLEKGGHLSWNKKNGLVAFDKLGEDNWFDLWIMNENATNQKCITCDHPNLPNHHIGQPAWHPTEEILVIQAQKSLVPRIYDTKCTPGAGTLNDLWVITADGEKVWKLHAVSNELSKDSGGVLHPHFSNDGTKLFWSERISGKGSKVFGEWILRIGEFSYDEERGPMLSNIRDYNPGNGSSFFESHSFSPDDKHVLFTGTQDGPLEIYEMEVETGNVKRLTEGPIDRWDEHAHYSPDGKKIAWISSKDLRFTIDPFDLETEFWIMDRNGSNKERITYLHDPKHPDYLDLDFAAATDLDWSQDGKQIMGLVITARPDTIQRGSGIIILINLEIDEIPICGNNICETGENCPKDCNSSILS